MNISFPPASQALPATTPTERRTPATEAGTAPEEPATVAPGSDADIVRAAEAALKSSSLLDGRVAEIRQAIQSGRVSFDADVLAAGILRYHGRQD